MNPKDNPFREIYLKHIEDQRNSGLSMKKYCLKHNIDTHKLSYYKTYKLKSNTIVKSESFSKVKLKS